MRRKPIFEDPPPAPPLPVVKQLPNKSPAPARVEPSVLIDKRTPDPPVLPDPPKATPSGNTPVPPSAPERTRMQIRLDA